MKKSLLVPMNLQLFAENENDDDGTSSIELEVVDDEVEIDVPVDDAADDVDEQTEEPEIDPKEQAKNKNNKANAKFRELRIKAEEAEKLSSIQKEIDEKFAKLAKEAGVDGVTNAKEYLDMVQRQIGVNKFKESNDPADLLETMEKRILDQVSGLVNQNTQQAESLAQEKFDMEMSKEYAALNDEFGTDVKKIEDILDLPNSDAIVDALDKGYDLPSAYKFANLDDIINQSSTKAKQKALNQIKGRSHVKSPGQGGEIETIKVTSGELQIFKQMYPGMSDTDLRKKIKSSRKYMS